MNIESIDKTVERIAAPPCKWLHWVSMVVMMMMMLLSVGDVLGRYLVGFIPFLGPIPGTFELTEFMLAVAVLTAIGHTQMQKGHIRIDIVLNLLPERVGHILDSITDFLGLIMFALVTWQSAKYAKLLYASNDVSGVLRVPEYPFLILVAIGSFLFCLAILSTFLKSFRKAIKK